MCKLIALFCTLLLLVSLISCKNTTTTVENEIPITTTPIINYAVTQHFPHDTSLFTEGLLFHNGQLFESTGSPSDLPHLKSMVGITDLTTGQFSAKIELDKSKYFGEGIVFLNNKLYQLTYTTKIGFIYNAKSFKQIEQFSFANNEGWALTTNGQQLIMSDGTSKLTYLDSSTLKPSRILNVTENNIPRDSLNELEFINGFIYANVWLSNFIVKINSTTGNVVGKLDLSSLGYEARQKNPNADVLNGIAYDSVTDKIYVTGKRWPNIYQINFPH